MANSKIPVPAGDRTSLRISSGQAIRTNPDLPNALAIDLENVVAAVNRLEQAIKALNGFSGTVVVRNADGTGTSSLTFVNGLCTAYSA